MHNQKMSNNIKPVEEILWDGGIELNKLFQDEHIPLVASQFIDQNLLIIWLSIQRNWNICTGEILKD